jgi:hypothetical protein
VCDRSFRFTALPAGSYTVEVRLQGLPDVVATRAGIVLPTAGGSFADGLEIPLHDEVAVKVPPK